jgi:hypothetical protein
VKQPDDCWDELFEPPKTAFERFFPLLALGLAGLLAWVS